MRLLRYTTVTSSSALIPFVLCPTLPMVSEKRAAFDKKVQQVCKLLPCFSMVGLPRHGLFLGTREIQRGAFFRQPGRLHCRGIKDDGNPASF